MQNKPKFRVEIFLLSWLCCLSASNAAAQLAALCVSYYFVERKMFLLTLTMIFMSVLAD